MRYNKSFIVTLFIFIVFNANCQTLSIFGGSNHDVYLGCLTCDTYDSNSIWNEYGTYGNKYNSTSIWNSTGSYGSEYTAYSPFNGTAQYPPVIVDENGKFYGYFTVNEYKPKRADFDLVLFIYKHHSEISENLSKWYKTIFQ